MAKGRKLAAELHREVVNRAYAKRMAAEVAPSRSAAPPSEREALTPEKFYMQYEAPGGRFRGAPLRENIFKFAAAFHKAARAAVPQAAADQALIKVAARKCHSRIYEIQGYKHADIHECHACNDLAEIIEQVARAAAVPAPGEKNDGKL